jgi:hypothetical protein
MPYVNKPRPYKRENELYKSKPEQIEMRVKRNKARRDAIRDGTAAVGDGKDVDHKVPLSKGGSNAKSNRRVVKASANRSFKRNADGSVK